MLATLEGWQYLGMFDHCASPRFRFKIVHGFGGRPLLHLPAGTSSQNNFSDAPPWISAFSCIYGDELYQSQFCIEIGMGHCCCYLGQGCHQGSLDIEDQVLLKFFCEWKHSTARLSEQTLGTWTFAVLQRCCGSRSVV